MRHEEVITDKEFLGDLLACFGVIIMLLSALLTPLLSIPTVFLGFVFMFLGVYLAGS